MAQTYRNKETGELVEAVLWSDEERFEALGLFEAHGFIDYTIGNDRIVFNGEAPLPERTVHPCWWIVRDSEGNFSPSDPDVFFEHFELPV